MLSTPCRFTSWKFSRVVEKDLDLGLKMSLGMSTTCSDLTSSSWEGQRRQRTTSSSSGGQEATPSWCQQPLLPHVAPHTCLGCKISAKPEAPASIPHSLPAYFQPFFFALLKAASIVHSYWRILQAVSPMQQNSIILCRRLVSISCFEDNCSTTNSLLNTHLHFLEVLSNYCLWGWRFLCLISVQWWFPCM